MLGLLAAVVHCPPMPVHGLVVPRRRRPAGEPVLLPRVLRRGFGAPGNQVVDGVAGFPVVPVRIPICGKVLASTAALQS